MFGGAAIIRPFPEIMKPFVMWYKTGIYKQQAIARKLLIPILTKRIAEEDRYLREGREIEWSKIKTDDTIQWVLDVTPPAERRPDRLVYRMMHISVAAVHTSSSAFLNALMCLAMTPTIHDDLRNEIETMLTAEGRWTKQALTHFIKLDSFMTEVMRLCVTAAGTYLHTCLP